MGASLTYLSEPVRSKDVDDGRVPRRARFGACGMQGWRRNQEDSHLAVADLDGTGRLSLFGVFDGHGGRGVSRYAAEKLPAILKATNEFKSGDYAQALTAAFFQVDVQLRTEEGRREIERLDATAAQGKIRVDVPRRVYQRMNKHNLRVERAKARDSEPPQSDDQGGLDSMVNGSGSENGKLSCATQDNASGLDKAASDLDEQSKRQDEELIDAMQPEDGEEEDDDVEDEELEEEFIKLVEGDEDVETRGPNQDGEAVDADGEEGGGDTELETIELDPSQVMKDPTPEAQGCTAIVCIIVWGEDSPEGANGARLICANAGDSRCVLGGFRDASVVSHAMSEDHKPENDVETARIEKAGGHVAHMPGGARVMGDLNLSRALGDLRYKDRPDLPAAAQKVTADPEIREKTLTSDDRFLVFGCDGIWERVENHEICEKLWKRLEETRGKEEQETVLLSTLGAEVCDEGLCPSMQPSENPSFDGSGCDNMTILLIEFDRPGEAFKGTVEASTASAAATAGSEHTAGAGEPSPKRAKTSDA